jgi:hypothetical protein
MDEVGQWNFIGSVPDGRLIKQVLNLEEGRMLIAAWDGHVGDLYLSCDSGHNFSQVYHGSGGGEILDRDAELIYAANLRPPYLLISNDLGGTWQPVPTPDSNFTSYSCSLITRLQNGHQQIVISCSRPGIILTTDDTGKHWSQGLSGKQFSGREFPKICGKGNVLAVCTTDAYDSAGINCYLSEKDGSKWQSRKNGFPGWAVDVDPINSSRICIGYFGPRTGQYHSPCVYESLDRGNTWTGLDSSGAWFVWKVQYLPDGGLLAATDKGLLRLSHN